MTRFSASVAVMLALVFAPTAMGSCWAPIVVAPAAPSFYYAAPVFYPQVMPVYTCNPAPVVQSAPTSPSAGPGTPAVGTYATPTPAPPSSPRPVPGATPSPPMPPASDRGPTSSESRYYDTYSVATRDPVSRTDRCSVAFWNLSGQDVALTVGDKSYTLARGRNLLTDADRQFVWKVAGREPQSEKVPERESALTIVIRR